MLKNKPVLNWQKFDDGDWQSFSGAEGDPEIIYLDRRNGWTINGQPADVVLVVADNGGTAQFWLSDDEAHDFYLNVDNHQVCKLVLENLAHAQTIDSMEALGFAHSVI